MSSFDAASAVSAYVPVPVIARETLHAGPIVTVKIPLGATEGAYPVGDEKIPFLQFSHTIPNGRVNLFVHTADSGLKGKRITAAASVLIKTLKDGREYLYIDLTPVDDKTPVTHRLAIAKNTRGSWDTLDHVVFETPMPLCGVIIFAPPGTKVVPTGNVVPIRAPVPEVEALRTLSTGDSQLDRLLAAGWEIESENSATVNLFRMKGDQRKTMVHHRPKKSRNQ